MVGSNKNCILYIGPTIFLGPGTHKIEGEFKARCIYSLKKVYNLVYSYEFQ